jgi:ATP-dependent DNA helicase RecG
MAPTELLAEQHWRNLSAWFKAVGQPIALLTGSQPARTRRSAEQAIASGEIQIVVGTHTLFQKGINFARLALIIVDEQHRFGVQQRMTLQEKGRAAGLMPHQLIMTATPIPRTLAMTAYADLDISVIDELPPGRTPVVTVVMADARRHEVVQRILLACRSGRQAYWVCPLIDESEELRYQAAEETAVALREALPELTVELVHGRQPAAQKEAAMAAFKANRVHLLVATTVIEVGVDVPNATVMVIEQAERFGLAQLHQLRGRVGRGAAQSYCILITERMSDTAKERIRTLVDTNDGFLIAEMDLKLRGPGEFFGTKQSGLPSLRVANILRDKEILEAARREALDFVSHPPSEEELRRAVAYIRDHWQRRYGLVTVG